ncbi:hypothetical protein MVEN_02505100 [Mycena venus]|uniref:Uncharacterized protein n=1 Tax=Mycena venus TaxID=2733690 RepID=A0A8H6WUG7_9AGAR|nr:hypothetical protein MVEN_02505100 [Mycena venus]
MAFLLALFTHLCMHLLGLMGNPVLTLIFSAVALLAYWLYLVLLPAIWPGRILDDTLTRIDEMKTRLHEEAARRRTLDMYSLSTYGLCGLEKLKLICNKLADDHRAYLNGPLYYLYVLRGLSLCKRARRCKRDVEAVCQGLDVEIQRFDDQDAPDDNEDAASLIRTRFNTVLTALFD